MRFKSSIAFAAMAVALTAPQAVMAQGVSMQEQLQLAQQQIAQMQAQLRQMQAQLNQQSQTQAQAAAEAQAASAKADQAIAQAGTAQAAAQAAKSTGVPDSMKWAADTKVSGRMYFNISSVSAKDGLGNSVEKDGGFMIKRFYVSVDHKFNNVLSGDITVDADNVLKSTTSNAGQGLYIKKAYLEAKLNPAFVVRLGATDMPWIPYVEGINGYRHVEKTLTDLDGFGTSSDWGVHVMGKLADGLVSYQVSAVDGSGYRNPRFTKTIDVEGRLSLQYHGFNAAIGGYVGKLGKNQQGATTYHTASRLNAALAYKGKVGDMPLTFGGEYFHAKNWNNVTGSLSQTSDITSEGYSLFASISPKSRWSVFGRYDWVKPNKEQQPLQVDHFFNVGIQYSPAKIVDLALVYKRDSADGGLKIGNLGSGQATRDEFGLYGQFRW